MPEPPVDLSAGGFLGNKNKFSVNLKKKEAISGAKNWKYVIMKTIAKF